MFLCILHCPISFFWNPNVTTFNFLCDIFFFLLLGSISLSSDFFANLLFLNSLFSLYFPSQYDPGANTKKNADDITSNDRGEDEGIFCFFKARPWCMVLYLSLYFFSFLISVPFSSPSLKQVHFCVLLYFLLVWKQLSLLVPRTLYMNANHLWEV